MRPSQRLPYRAFVLLVILFTASAALAAQSTPSKQTFKVQGLEGDAEILVDKWGVPHIYAQHHYDAFFVQGFNAARDRLWQIDLWRRRGLGQLSEVLGSNFIEQDKAARLFLYRRSMFREWLAYGSDAKQIATSFTAGINAYVKLIETGTAPIPPEFKVLDYKPAHWAAEDVVRIRSNGLWRNVVNEVHRANVICNHGVETDALRRKLEPAWTLTIPKGLDPCDVPYDAIKLYALAQAPVDFSRVNHLSGVKRPDFAKALAMLDDNVIDAGSNNWAVAPSKTSTGRAILANDPHRGHAVPSLRYIAHLVAPGLNVIGAGEPALPGISIGHNEKIAFGLTIFSIDQEDLVVYETKGDQYRYKDQWQPMTIVKEKIAVRDEPSVEQELKFTRDGPVIYTDDDSHRAFAVRAAWLEAGMAPYFGSVEYMRANNWHEFLGALNRWGAPSENQVYADIDGNIGYKPAGLTPIRKNYDGLLPVPGNGEFEWHGFYDMDQLPVQYNPPEGFVATANAMSLPDGYPYQERIIGFEWADPWRIQRIKEVLSSDKKHTFTNSVDLQRDYLSIPARRILKQLDIEALPELARQFFSGWNFRLEQDSGASALFEVWHNVYLMPSLFSDATGLLDFSDIGSVDKQVMIDHFEKMPAIARQKLANSTLRSTIIELSEMLNGDPEQWRWGDLHKMRFSHPLLDYASEPLKKQMSIQPVARGGSADTPNSTRYRQDYSVASGASWRMVVDVGNWDAAVMTNAPGQSGDPSSQHYDDMLKTWADDGHMPLLFSRKKILANTEHIIMLIAQ
ncbi:MAG: penicillin amidase [Dinoroseobacter sp.]|jgi:penicillin amidase